jgi:hypothetical protein
MMRKLIQARTAFGWIVRMLLLFGITFAIMMIGARLPMTPLVVLILNFLPLITMAVFIISLVLLARSAFSMQGAGIDASDGKPKRGESLGELMSILNDGDIDDLRARVKARLEEQIDSTDASEMETFADLLDETKRKRRS